MNWDPIFDIIQEDKVPDWDKELIAAAVEKVVKEFYEADRKLGIISTEQYGDEPAPFKIDLVLGRATPVKIVDWKTKKAGKLDERWVMRETRSPQARIYAAAVATLYEVSWPLLYEVRGVTLEEKPKTKVLRFSLDAPDARAGVEHLRSVEAQRACLVERGKTPWTKNDKGCRIYGDNYKCEFEAECWEGKRAPQVGEYEESLVTRAFSHSSAGEFLRCPERYRLLRIVGTEEDDDSTNTGTLFHKVMEHIYAEVKKEQQL